MDTTMTDHLEMRHVTQSSSSLEKDIAESMEKIKTIIQIIMYLAEVGQSEDMPTFSEMLSSKDAQRKVKDRLIKQSLKL